MFRAAADDDAVACLEFHGAASEAVGVHGVDAVGGGVEIGVDDGLDDGVVDDGGVAAFGEGYGDGFADNVSRGGDERGIVAEDALRLQQQRGDDSDGVMAEFAPGDRSDVRDGDGVGGGAGEERDEGGAEGVVLRFEEHGAALVDD